MVGNQLQGFFVLGHEILYLAYQCVRVNKLKFTFGNFFAALTTLLLKFRRPTYV
jgi:hypothetical protein